MKAKFRGSSVPYILVLPAAIYVAVIAGFPVLKGLELSFTRTMLLRPSGGAQVGVDNYVDILSSPAFGSSLWTTIVYSALTVAGSLFLGTVAALALNRAFVGRTFARAVLIVPWAVPTVAAALVFRWMFNNSSGVANNALSGLGIGEVGWLTDPNFGMFSVLLVTLWKVTPLVMLVVLAALQSIPEELHEAARVDGASAYTTFFSVVLPQLAPTLRVLGLLMLIWSFRRFEVIWLMTGGGPVGATNTVVVNVYREAFVNGQLGMAAALGMIGLLLSLCVTVIYGVVESRNSRKNGVTR